MTIESLENELTDNERLGLEIKTWLVRKRLRQADLAVALGVSQGSISQRLVGNQSFSITELLKTAELFGITLGDLIGSELLNEKGPRSAARNEGLGELPQLDSNQQPLD